jgi:hypothetical protein
MKILSLFIVLVLFSLNVGLSHPSQDNIVEKVVNAIKTMDAAKLSVYFGSMVDLEAGESDGSYSKTQAEIIMRKFFDDHPLTSFKLNHQGSSNDGSQYFIGTYKTTKKEYRVYVLMKSLEGDMRIKQIQFEEE